MYTGTWVYKASRSVVSSPTLDSAGLADRHNPIVPDSVGRMVALRHNEIDRDPEAGRVRTKAETLCIGDSRQDVASSSCVQCLDHHLGLVSVRDKKVANAEDRVHCVHNLVEAAGRTTLLSKSDNTERIAVTMLDHRHNLGGK